VFAKARRGARAPAAWRGVAPAARRGVLTRCATAGAALTLMAAACVAVPPPAFAAVSSHARTIAGGTTHSCAIRGGKAYCWGGNANGQLGNSSTINSSVPVAVTTSGVLSGKTVTQVSTGQPFTCAVDAAGAAYCWGANGSGQLGNSTNFQSLVPVA
jgi:alpha-tubulin suppressor-like RCC1 family protein